MKIEDNILYVDPPKSTKKITGTRFASLLGYNKWNTPFATWCEITKVYQQPYEDTKYTIAGKTIEPIQHEYMRRSYNMNNLVSPEDVYGDNFFDKTRGDFFPNINIFGGMWDALLVDENGVPNAVLEFKTTSRAEDWKNGVPVYYGLQGSLYAKLLGVERVIMVCSFLESKDYDTPSEFKPCVANTIIEDFNIHEKYKNFDLLYERAIQIWNENVLTGVSLPIMDKDAELVKILKTTKMIVENDNEFEALISKAEELKAELDANKKAFEKKEKEFSKIKDAIKKKQLENITSENDRVTLKGNKYTFETFTIVGKKIDEDKLKQDGLYDKYLKQTVTYRFDVKEVK